MTHQNKQNWNPHQMTQRFSKSVGLLTLLRYLALHLVGRDEKRETPIGHGEFSVLRFQRRAWPQDLGTSCWNLVDKEIRCWFTSYNFHFCSTMIRSETVSSESWTRFLVLLLPLGLRTFFNQLRVESIFIILCTFIMF